ncbi:MAG: hypothetical protein IJF70_07385 [Opitutales bacterium]|nr:hypothetical protein [Opitutales bacterium]
MRTKKVELNGTIRLSMSNNIKQIAKEQADLYFTGNISAYIAHLILKDVDKTNVEYNNSGGVQITAPIKKTKITNKVKR